MFVNSGRPKEDRALAILQYILRSSTENLCPRFKCLSIRAIRKQHCGTGQVLFSLRDFAILNSSRYILFVWSEFKYFYRKFCGVCTTEHSHTEHISLPRVFLFAVMLSKSINRSIDQSIKNVLPHIDNKVQHIQVELMWERWKLKCNTYNTLSPFINSSENIFNLILSLGLSISNVRNIHWLQCSLGIWQWEKVCHFLLLLPGKFKLRCVV